MTRKTNEETALMVAAAARWDKLITGDFELFFRRALATIAPAAPYESNWHIGLMIEYLKACEQGEIQRLIINLPPRMLKSSLVSVAWPAWMLGHNPRARLLVASYAQSLATKHSLDCRVVMQSRWYQRLFPNTRLSADQNEKDRFTTTQRGFRLATSVGGAAIGEGGDMLIVDDPISPLQVHQTSQRAAVNGWFDHTFATRLDDKRRGAMVVVMQRLHPEDLSGYLLAKGGWEHLCLPALAPEATRYHFGKVTYDRAAGEPLHPTREGVALLERAKRELGSANFNAQYQQAPLAQRGSVLKPHWFTRFKQEEAIDREGATYVQSWDTAIKTGQGNDPSVCLTFAERAGVHHLVDVLCAKLEYPDLRRAVIAQAQRFSPNAILMEDKASGQSLMQDLRRETDLPILPCTPTADKLTRLLRNTPTLEAGRIALPQHAPWLASLEAEWFHFPDSPHDDQVDALSQYLDWLRRRSGLGRPNMRRV